MFPTDDLYFLQFQDWDLRQLVEKLKEIARIYDQFWLTREIEDFDKADVLYEELKREYNMPLSLLGCVKLGRAFLVKKSLPSHVE